MNILFYTTNEVAPQYGGVERVTANIANALTTFYNVNCYSAYKYNIDKSFIKQQFVNTIKINSYHNLNNLIQFIEQNKIDVIINQGEHKLTKSLRLALNQSQNKKCKLMFALHVSPATPGMEGRKTVTLQSHLDMVPQKNSSVKHDFEKDPIDAYIDGDWVTARETTLGADNGMGAALAMAVLADNSLRHGPIEALFTIDEEQGMDGAFGLKPHFLQGDILLNCDSEKEGELFVGCAGGANVNVSFQFKEDTYIPEGDVAVKVSLSGLKGGHSGVDIHLGRANANKLIFRFLKEAVCDYGARLSSVAGGSLPNAIPREAFAVITIPGDNVESLWELVADYQDMFLRRESLLMSIMFFQ